MSTNQDDEMGRTCGMYRAQKFIQESGREIWWKEFTWEDLGIDGKLISI